MLIAPELWRPSPSIDPLDVAARQIVNVLIWIGLNLVLVRYHGLERLDYRASRPDTSDVASLAIEREAPLADAPVSPSFLMRLKKPVGRLWALVAEEHYLRVVGEQGEDLILYRISDAVQELEEHDIGARVHRSFWVARDAVSFVERTASGSILVLHNGMRVPVSRSFRSAAASAGLLRTAGKTGRAAQGACKLS